MSITRQQSRTFVPAPTSVADARRFARGVLTEWGLDDVLDDVVLLVSELVTNAVTHAGTPTTVAVVHEPDRLRLDVVDLHPTSILPVGPNGRPGAGEHGRGLLITATLATTWGVEYRKDQKRVWAAFALVGAVAEGIDDGGPVDGPVGGPDVAAVRPSAPVAAVPTGPAAEADPLGLSALVLNQLALDDLLKLVVEQARERLGADASYLLLEDEIDDRFVVAATCQLPASLQGTPVRRGEPGAPKASAPFQPLWLGDLSATPVELLDGLGLRSLVVAPVVFDGRVIGALAAAKEQSNGFVTEDATLLQRAADWAAATVDRARMRAADGERRGWLAFVADAGVMLSSSLDLETTVAMTAQIVVPRLALWCGVYLNDPRGRTSLEYAWHADEHRLDALRTVLERAAGTADTAPPEPEVDDEAAVLPLEARNRVIGWLVLGRRRGEPLRRERLLVAESVARRAALAIDNARAHTELHEIGRTLQRSLLPAELPVTPGIDVGVAYQSAGEYNDVGGDFYDVFELGAGRWCFVVGDVCGIGPEAAAVTGMARHTVRALMRSGVPIGPTLERLNAAICDEGPRGRFLTLICGTVAAAADGYRLRVVCAGHPPPFLLSRADPLAPVRRLGRPQPLLGVFDAVDYIEEEHQVVRGDRLVLVTDGVLERRDGARMFEEPGVEAELLAGREVGAQRAADNLLQAVTDFSYTPPSDDLAIMVLDLGRAVGERGGRLPASGRQAAAI